jgi:hypothetical protein
MSKIGPQPQDRPLEAAESGPQIGVDEWVAQREGRLAASTTVAGRVQQQLARVPQWVLLAGFVAVVALIPVITSDEYVLRVTADTMLYVLLAIGLNVAVGWAGILDLGTSRSTASPPTCSPNFRRRTTGSTGRRGRQSPSDRRHDHPRLLLALPTRRLSGDYLAIVTLFFE